MNLLHEKLTSKIIQAFYNVYNTLGYGFLEKVYENAMMIELKKMELEASQQVPIIVRYDSRLVGEFFADLLIEESVIVELKTLSKLEYRNEKQLENYLKATPIEVGLLLNFGPKPEVKRRIFENECL